MNNIIQFNDLKNEFEEKKESEKAEKDLEYEARCLFDSALYSTSSKKARELALDAYELKSDSYEYKTFAISKMDDNKLAEYENLLKEINHKIEVSNEEDALFKIYSKDEIYSKRYIELEYLYCLEKIKNKQYDIIDLLDDIASKYSEYKFKVKHLKMGICLINNDYKECIALYDKISDENILELIPLAYAYLKLKQFKRFVCTIYEIDELNVHFKEVIYSANIKKIKSAKSRYLFGTKAEVYFAFRDFCDLYFNDLEFINEIKNLKL